VKASPKVDCKIKLAQNVIHYTSSLFPEWKMGVGDLRLFGEATNQYGPFADDYFLCFASSDYQWHEASFYCEGRDEFLAALRDYLGCDIPLKLCDSTDFASNILWPEALSGEPMFSFEDSASTSYVKKLFGAVENTQRLSDQALSVITKNNA